MIYLDNIFKKKLQKKIRFYNMQKRHDMRAKEREIKDKKFKTNLMLDWYMVKYNRKTKEWESKRKTNDIDGLLDG